MKLSKFILMWSLSMSIMIALSSSSFFFTWMALEINMMSFIPLMNSKTAISTNSMLLYLIIQSTASSLFLLSITILNLNSNFNFIKMSFIMTCSLLIKVGAAPFHYWFPLISEGMSYSSLFVLSTIQKIIPLYILSMNSNYLILISIILSSLIGSTGGFNQTSFRKILAFSSITHIAWMLTLIFLNSNLWMVYLAIYTVILLTIMHILYTNSINWTNQISMIKKEATFSLLISFLSLGGMPPLIGFSMKWLTLKIIMLYTALLSIPLILSSLINLFFYTRAIYPFLLKNFPSNKWNFSYTYDTAPLLMTQIFPIFILIPFL
uniref:NADH-ubiquinone oxidoreductase chain 2 n=1 Tax=Ornithodoros coriaceus TaxID=92741 RepID=A0A3G2KJW0_ORNCO|nr:NADH dehydrogenase subunit 2 [Ornithodoros coriaceus]AYN59498.1 NADH dehydrogenase subunit 2 [Ornithodoros coriaceus]